MIYKNNHGEVDNSISTSLSNVLKYIFDHALHN